MDLSYVYFLYLKSQHNTHTIAIGYMCYTPRIILVFTARKSRLVAPVDCVNGSLYIVVLYGKYIMQYNRFVNGAVQCCIRT